MDALEKQVEINNLLMFYLPLLTDKQKQLMQYYYQDNYSLSEIAELNNTSRNAVHDGIKKTLQKLYDFEEKLQLKTKYEKRESLINQAFKLNDINEIHALLDALKKVE